MLMVLLNLPETCTCLYRTGCLEDLPVICYTAFLYQIKREFVVLFLGFFLYFSEIKILAIKYVIHKRVTTSIAMQQEQILKQMLHILPAIILCRNYLYSFCPTFWTHALQSGLKHIINLAEYTVKKSFEM